MTNELKQIRDALEKNIKTFRWYEEMHAAKPDMEKARRNAEFAAQTEQALSTLDRMMAARGDTQAALDAIFLTICPTITWPSGEECQQGRITLEQYNIIRAAFTAKPDVNAELLGALKYAHSMMQPFCDDTIVKQAIARAEQKGVV